jgi:hypothetical protein
MSHDHWHGGVLANALSSSAVPALALSGHWPSVGLSPVLARGWGPSFVSRTRPSPRRASASTEKNPAGGADGLDHISAFRLRRSPHPCSAESVTGRPEGRGRGFCSSFSSGPLSRIKRPSLAIA